MTKRKPSESRVINYGKQLLYKNIVIDYIMDKKKWTIDGGVVGSISNLSMELYKITKDPEFHESTYKIGRILEDNGFEFNLSFYLNDR